MLSNIPGFRPKKIDNRPQIPKEVTLNNYPI